MDSEDDLCACLVLRGLYFRKWSSRKNCSVACVGPTFQLEWIPWLSGSLTHCVSSIRYQVLDNRSRDVVLFDWTTFWWIAIKLNERLTFDKPLALPVPSAAALQLIDFGCFFSLSGTDTTSIWITVPFARWWWWSSQQLNLYANRAIFPHLPTGNVEKKQPAFWKLGRTYHLVLLAKFFF